MARDDVLAALRDHLAYCVVQVPWYRNRSDAYDPARLRSRRSFSRLPLLTRDDIRRGYPLELVADGIDLATGVRDGWVELLQSSGTTGERVTVAADPELPGAPLRDLELWDLEPDPRLKRVVVFTSPGCLGRACELPHAGRLRFGGRQLILPSSDEPFLLERDFVRVIVDELIAHDAGMWFANPAYLHALIRACRTFDIALPSSSLVLASYQYLSHHQRRAIAPALGARVYSYYGASELGRATVAMECKRGRMHVWQEQSYVEVIDDDGELVRPGQRGRLVITALASRVTPVVRYLIGDVGALHDEDCDCPLGGSPVLELCGREKDALLVEGRTITPRDVDEALAHVRGIDVYQVEQRGTEVEARVLPALDEPLDIAALRDALSSIGLPNVRVREVDNLDPEPSGKIPLTIRRA